MASQTDICNLALIRIGVQQQLVNVQTDGTLPALSALLIWDRERQFVLRDFPWSWATKYAALAGQVANPNPDWKFSYTMPADSLFDRRIATSTGRLEANPPAFRRGTDNANNPVLFTDAAAGTLEYTYDVTDTTKFDPEFSSLLAWRLAANLALGLSRIQDHAKFCLEAYAGEKAQAEARAAREAQKDIAENTSQAVLDIVNLALMRIGVTKDNDLKAAADVMAQGRLVQKAFIFERDFVLRDFPWKWATNYADAVVEFGSPSTPANHDWVYAYHYPDDAVFIRRLIPSTTAAASSSGLIYPHHSRLHRSHQHPFVIGSDGEGQVIFSNLATPTIEYTRKLTSDAEFDTYDRMFTSMLAWRLAATLAPSRLDPKLVDKKVQTCINAYLLEKTQAEAANLNESAQRRDDDAEWIAAR